MKVEEIIKEIRENRNKDSANGKDELKFMRAMLNDKEYEVDVYNSKEKISTFNPSEAARETLAIGIAGATKISNDEAIALAEQHEFGKREAQNYIGISKQFILGYGQTGRKINLGTRVDSDISISMKEEEAKPCSYPKKVGVDDNGKDIYENVIGDKMTPAHWKLSASSPCPSHLKK